MAFQKTGLSVTRPKVTTIVEVEFGFEKNGKFWDGENWISKEDFEKIKGKKNG